MISDAQLILGFSRHLTAYSVSPVHAELETLRFAGQVHEMAWRLRNAQVSSAERVRAIGIDAKIGPLDLDRYVLSTMEQLWWVQCDRRPDGTLVSVSAYIPPNTELLAATDQLLGMLLATPVQRAALEIMRATSIQPLERQAALQAGSGHGDEAAERALSCLITVNLVREVPSEDGRAAVFNPNIWIGDSEMMMAALRTEDARVQREVGALIEEIMASPGIPEEHVTSTEQRWIDFAVSAGQVHVRYISRAAVRTRSPSGCRIAAIPIAPPGPLRARAPARLHRHCQWGAARVPARRCGRRPPPGSRHRQLSPQR